MSGFKQLIALLLMGVPIIGLTQLSKALLFIDSNNEKQLEIVNKINKELQLSPTLSRGISLEVIDILGGLVPRFSTLRYRVDTYGEWVVKYKPRNLPWLICSVQNVSHSGCSITQHDAIRRCLGE
ncbi:hypothetical protein [Yersinia pseudotuberculosis]|uniref:hypothetical protein n=1 Tax=Yersinia pseudotuberculosis TaxID=633 RepID=UPI0005DDB49D|nr:hypothetical protein [Yersinia pseudotuberculosis]CNC66778.1 Uncharacterised protein [Yersinia pseudotuberculosis]